MTFSVDQPMETPVLSLESDQETSKAVMCLIRLLAVSDNHSGKMTPFTLLKLAAFLASTAGLDDRSQVFTT